MDLTIERDEFSRGLARIQGVIERRGTHPILSHVLLQAKDSGLKITATNTEVAYIGDLTASVQKTGEIAVDATQLFQMVRQLPEPSVRLSLQAGRRLEVSSGRASFRLPGCVSEEYPALPDFQARGQVKLQEHQLKQLVEQTSFSIARDDARYGLNGAHIEEQTINEEPRLRMVSTDGHRLSSSQCSFDGKLDITPRMLIPRKALTVLRKLLDSGGGEIDLSFGEGAIKIKRPGQEFWFRLIDGEFPDYRAVVPTSSSRLAKIRTDVLSSALKRVSILVQDRDRARAVCFEFKAEELKIDVTHLEKGEAREFIAIEFEGEPITIGFNAGYLQDILSVTSSEFLTMEMGEVLDPCIVKAAQDPDSFFVVMPMQLD